MALAASARPWVSATWTALGTQADVLVTEPRAMREVQQLVAHQLDEIDLACSRFREDSELAHINRSPGRWVKVSQLFFDALEAALGAASASGGAVDPTLGRVLRLAGYDRDFADVRSAPGPARLMLTRAPGWKKIQVDYVHRAVRLPHGVELDLGATAKALAADRAATDAARLTHAGRAGEPGRRPRRRGPRAGRRLAGAGDRRPRRRLRRAWADRVDRERRPRHLEHHGAALAERRARAASHLRPTQRPPGGARTGAP